MIIPMADQASPLKGQEALKPLDALIRGYVEPTQLVPTTK